MKYHRSGMACPCLRSHVFDEQKGLTRQALTINVISLTSVSVKTSPVVNGKMDASILRLVYKNVMPVPLTCMCHIICVRHCWARLWRWFWLSKYMGCYTQCKWSNTLASLRDCHSPLVLSSSSCLESQMPQNVMSHAPRSPSNLPMDHAKLLSWSWYFTPQAMW